MDNEYNTTEPHPELDTDLTPTFWFMLRFFGVTLLIAAAAIGGSIVLIRWAIGL